MEQEYVDISSKDAYIHYINEREAHLSLAATKSIDACYAGVKKGKSPNIDLSERLITEHSFRSPFQEDLDAITYSKYFMKLHGKTQMFISPQDIQMITRASHTDVVLNIASDIARGLSLNEDLTFAIAKGHDIGHTAFGHAGEDALDFICQEHFSYTKLNDIKNQAPSLYESIKQDYPKVNEENFVETVPVFRRLREDTFKEELKRDFFVGDTDIKIFSHAKQALRFLCFFEGKKLTAQTIFGIMNHNYNDIDFGSCRINLEIEVQRAEDKNPLRNIVDTELSKEIYRIDENHDSLEAQVVRFADFLSFSIHDLDDGLRSGKLSFNEIKEMFSTEYPNKRFSESLVGAKRYTQFIVDYIKENRRIISAKKSRLRIPEESLQVLSWLFDNVIRQKIHHNPEVIRKNIEGQRYINGLYMLWKKDRAAILHEFPDLGYNEINTKFMPQRSPERVFSDFISSLTDNEIIKVYRTFYGPEQ